MNKRFNKLIEIAHALYPSKDGRCHHVSFVLDKNRIVSIGQNKKKTNPFNLRHPKYNKEGMDVSSIKYTCSELSALKKIKPSKNLTLVNVRIDNNKKVNYSKPCASCKSLIKYFNLKKVFYTNGDGIFEEMNLDLI